MNLTLDQLTRLLALMRPSYMSSNSFINLYKILGDEWLERVKKEDPESQEFYFKKVRGEK